MVSKIGSAPAHFSKVNHNEYRIHYGIMPMVLRSISIRMQGIMGYNLCDNYIQVYLIISNLDISKISLQATIS